MVIFQDRTYNTNVIDRKIETMNTELKGGVGGKSTRMRERFRVETPEPEVLAKYFAMYSGEHLYAKPEDVLAPSSETLFGNGKPLVVDLGCGRGEYLISLANESPDNNHVGVDFHTRSLYVGVHQARAQGLENIMFLRANFEQLLPFFLPSSTESISILFPAPIVNPTRIKSDVLKPSTVQEIYRVLRPGGRFLFKSDAPWYFSEKLGLIEALGLFEIGSIIRGIEEPITRYQRQWQSKGIVSNSAEMVKKPA